MSIISTLTGDTIAKPIEAIGNVFDQLFTSEEEREQAKFVLEKLRQHPYELQAEINKLEAQHRSIFVAGWRPAVGWICAIALAWHFILYDLFVWISVRHDPAFAPPELGGTEQLLTVLLAMLGIGGLRTVEKLKGKTK